MIETLLSIGLSIAGVISFIILWSVLCPNRRVWPPSTFGPLTMVLVWLPTLTMFGILIGLGILGWGEFLISPWLRYGLGIPLIALANWAVWSEVRHFGLDQTSGAQGTLRTAGLYRYSRHPQYVADAVLVASWLLLSASPAALPVGLAMIVILLIAPLAEEPWLREKYGSQYDEYSARVRRYF